MGLNGKKKKNKLSVKTEYNGSHYEQLGYALMGELKAGGLQVHRGESSLDLGAFLSHCVNPSEVATLASLLGPKQGDIQGQQAGLGEFGHLDISWIRVDG